MDEEPRSYIVVKIALHEKCGVKRDLQKAMEHALSLKLLR